MAYDLPAGFPNPTYDSETDLDLGFISTKMDSGTSRVRRRFPGFRESGTLVWELVTRQRSELFDLLKQYGADWFRVTYLPVSAETNPNFVTVEVWARPTGNLTARSLGYDAHRVSMPVEIMR